MLENTPPPANPTPYVETNWDRPTRLIALVFLLISSTLALLLLAPVFPILTVALLLAFVLYNPVRMLTTRLGLPWALSALVMYLGFVIAIVFIVLAIIPTITKSAENLVLSAQDAYGDLLIRLDTYEPGDAVLVVAGAHIDFDPIVQQIREVVSATNTTLPQSEAAFRADREQLQAFLDQFITIAGPLTGAVTSVVSGVAGFLASLLLALFISFLIVLDIRHSSTALYNALSPAYRREVSLLIKRIEHVWGAFLQGQVIVGLLLGFLTYIQLILMGIPNALLLAIITGFISLIPTIGGFIAMVPLAFVPALQGSTVIMDTSPFGLALLVVLINLIISQIIWNAIAPVIIGDALALPTVVIICGVFIGAAVGGALGAFLVAPVLATIKVVVLYLLAKISQRDPYPGEVLPLKVKEPA